MGPIYRSDKCPLIPTSTFPVSFVTETAQGANTRTGQMIAYQADPTVVIETGDGKQRSWLASLTRPATPEEAEQFWRDRALVAERKLKELAHGGNKMALDALTAAPTQWKHMANTRQHGQTMRMQRNLPSGHSKPAPNTSSGQGQRARGDVW